MVVPLVVTDDARSLFESSADLEPEALPPPPPAPRPRSRGRAPVFGGSLEEFCLPDLLQLLRNTRRTGLLTCTTSTGIGRVLLSGGMIVGADSPSALDLRWQVLNSPGLAPERRAVLAALPVDSFSDEAIDDAIAARGLVSRDDVASARVARIYSAFREMIGWTSGRFSFDPEVTVNHPRPALSVQSILMRLWQEQDEQAR
jgi:hypothetical protein